MRKSAFAALLAGFWSFKVGPYVEVGESLSWRKVNRFTFRFNFLSEPEITRFHFCGKIVGIGGVGHLG
jgi:hypothetical protein